MLTEGIDILHVHYADSDDLMIINRSGVMIRMAVDELRVMGRNTQGVKLINLKEKDEIASVTKVPGGKEEEMEGACNEEGDNDAPAENS